jgi:hypothetical protein
MHTYRKIENELWVVGYWIQGDAGGAFWEALQEFSTQSNAAAYVNYLNGGDGDFDHAGTP